ncbi:MAG TPA: phosphatidylinositol mannoside acyltransferase [Acidimicrobiales bacterium]|nr:phosphatidylinositol mannoside acyltransferase [Acidimicrobiales bacterium]
MPGRTGPLRARVRTTAVVGLYRAGSVVANALPESAPEPLSRVVAPVLAAALGNRRRMVARHLRRVHGDVGEATLRREVRRSFASYARYWLESFRVPDRTPDELQAGMSCDGFENIEAGLAAGSGVILALPHLGGWEYGGAWLASLGHPVTVVVEPLEPPELFTWFADFREGLGMEVVPLGPGVSAAVLRALRANRIVCLLCDRDLVGDGPEVTFFGERTTLPAGPVTLAFRSGAPVLPTAVYFEGRDRHRGQVEPPLELPRRGRLRDDVAAGTQSLATALEGLIAAAPEQWHLLQPNWPSDREVAGG